MRKLTLCRDCKCIKRSARYERASHSEDRNRYELQSLSSYRVVRAEVVFLLRNPTSETMITSVCEP